jgi:flagellin-like protein
MKQFAQNEEAVSPVIGVILMVAITVILAAVIAAFVFGMTGNVDAQKNVAVGVKQESENVTLTIQGGQDLSKLQYIKVTVKGADYYTEKNNPVLSVNALTSTTTPVDGEISVGKIYTRNVALTSASERVVVVGHFNDGKEQMLVDTNI